MPRVNQAILRTVMNFVLLLMEEEEEHSNFMRLNLLMAGEFLSVRSSCSRVANLARGRLAGHDRLFKDYFAANAVFPPHYFRRRFRMEKHLFVKIEEAVVANNEYFIQRPDATGMQGLSSLQKVTATIRMLAYNASVDQNDEYVRFGETTSLLCLKEFCETIVSVFSVEYLRSPRTEDTRRILRHSATRGWPGMMGSVDCMHWDWKQCPRQWAGQFQDRHGNKNMILEAVATYDLWIWHSFFGCPGSLNDLNVLGRSHLFYNLLRGTSPEATFTIQGRVFHQTYYLADGIYPNWPVFVQSLSNPIGEKRKHFSMMQEAARKDIERAFGVLRQRWAILRHPSRLWQKATLRNVMLTCLILHNMIVQDEQARAMDCLNWTGPDVVINAPERPPTGQDWRDRIPQYHATRLAMRNTAGYHDLQECLIDHAWSIRRVGRQEGP